MATRWFMKCSKKETGIFFEFMNSFIITPNILNKKLFKLIPHNKLFLELLSFGSDGYSSMPDLQQLSLEEPMLMPKELSLTQFFPLLPPDSLLLPQENTSLVREKISDSIFKL